jgi:hypothetical protein
MSVDERALAHHQLVLVELVDRVLNRGVVVAGDITLSVAGVDLVYLGLRLLLSSVGSLEELRGQEPRPRAPAPSR